MKLGQYNSALADLEKALELNPGSTKTLSYLALVEDKLGQKQKAKKHMAEAFAHGYAAPVVYVNRALFDLNQRNAKKALEDVNQALSIDPYLKDAYEARAKIYKLLGKADDSASDTDRANKLIAHIEF